jgi:SAM-dependent methyltransferase
MRLRPLIKGIVTFVPGSQWLLPKAKASRHPPPEYYYGVWLKHIALLRAHGLDDNPRSVAELGPGDALGLGISALLSGVQRYHALDVVAHADLRENLAAFEAILALLRRRAGRPSKGWPDFDSLLDARLFPSQSLTEARLDAALEPARVERVRQLLINPGDDAAEPCLRYHAPWFDSAIVEQDSIDLVISQAVLEHVNDVPGTYQALYRWLKPGGVMSHQIDFGAHELTAEFNGYRAISEPVWKLMMGRRPYLINRVPCSEHLRAIEAAGFEIVVAMKHQRPGGVDRARLAPLWQHLSDEDLGCAELLVQARKPQRAH